LGFCPALQLRIDPVIGTKSRLMEITWRSALVQASQPDICKRHLPGIDDRLPSASLPPALQRQRGLLALGPATL